MIRVFSALSLVASAPCVLSGQNPAPTPAPARPAPPHQEVPAAPAQRRVEVRRMVGAPGAMYRLGAMRGMGAMHGMMMMDAASMFLAHTGELQLTDAQVTRLAAIARRSEARMHAIRARMDSAMTAMRSMDSDSPGDGMPMARAMVRMPMPTDAERKAQHEDDKEAFSVPTPDQLATAWELMKAHR